MGIKVTAIIIMLAIVFGGVSAQDNLWRNDEWEDMGLPYVGSTSHSTDLIAKARTFLFLDWDDSESDTYRGAISMKGLIESEYPVPGIYIISFNGIFGNDLLDNLELEIDERDNGLCDLSIVAQENMDAAIQIGPDCRDSIVLFTAETPAMIGLMVTVFRLRSV